MESAINKHSSDLHRDELPMGTRAVKRHGPCTGGDSPTHRQTLPALRFCDLDDGFCFILASSATYICIAFWGYLGGMHSRQSKVSPRFSKFRGVSGSLGQICLGLPKRFRGRFHLFWGRSFWECQKVLWKVPRKVPFRVSPTFQQGSTKVPSRSREGFFSRLLGRFLGADPICLPVPSTFFKSNFAQQC